MTTDEGEDSVVAAAVIGAGFFSVHAIGALVLMSGVDRAKYLSFLEALRPEHASPVAGYTYTKLLTEIKNLIED